MLKKYFSEALIISRFDNLYNIIDLLYWYLNIIKFNKITLIINKRKTKKQKIIENLFPKNVEFINCPGKISQTDTYNKFVNNSESYWVFPVDDDEYLYISDKYDNNINKLLLYNIQKNNSLKYSFTWAMMFSKELYTKIPNKKSYLDTYNYAFINNNILAENILNVKTILNTTVHHLFTSDNIANKKIIHPIDINWEPVNIKLKSNYEHMGTVHNPITILNNKFIHSLNLSTNIINIGYNAIKNIDLSEDVLLLHFKYRSYNEWIKKVEKKSFTADTAASHISYNNESLITNYYSLNNNFIKFEKGKMLYDKFKSDIDILKNQL